MIKASLNYSKLSWNSISHSPKYFYEVDFKTRMLPNGESLAYYEYGVGKNVIFLLHNNTGSGYFFNKFSQLLIDDFRVIAPDLRGFGHSTMVTPFKTHRDLAGDIVFLADKMKIDRFHLFGWSFGGAVAMNLAAIFQDRVRNVIL